MPQSDSNSTADIVSLEAVNGVCTSQRRPPVSVTVGDMRHESCAYADQTPIAPSRRRGEFGMYWLVTGSSATWLEMVVIRPVICAKCARALPSCVASAPGMVVDVNRLNAGSHGLAPQLSDDMPRLTCGTTVVWFSQALDRRYPPPRFRLCEPICQFNELSNVYVGAALQLGVRSVHHSVTLLNGVSMAYPPMSANELALLLGSDSWPKAELPCTDVRPTRNSLTMLLLSVDRRLIE